MNLKRSFQDESKLYSSVLKCYGTLTQAKEAFCPGVDRGGFFKPAEEVPLYFAITTKLKGKY